MKRITRYLKFVYPPKQAWRVFRNRCYNNHSFQTPKIIPAEWSTIYYKAYTRFPEIKLPKPNIITKSLGASLQHIHSTRDFSDTSMNLSSVSTLLNYAIGLRKKPSKSIETNPFRHYPSAGARYPIEAYLVAFRVHGLSKGLYHYYVKSHTLEHLAKLPNDIETFFQSPFPTQSAFILILTAFFPRTTAKYKNRGYNYALIEAGHIGQNVYLLSNALGVGCCGLGGYYDDKLNGYLRLNTDEESVLYTLCIGKERK